MWSDEARAAALEARKRGAHSKTHQGKNGNRKIAKKANKDASIAGGVAKGAAIGGAVGAAAGGLALRQFGGAKIGATLPNRKSLDLFIAGAKAGAVVGGVYRAATRHKGKKK